METIDWSLIAHLGLASFLGLLFALGAIYVVAYEPSVPYEKIHIMLVGFGIYAGVLLSFYS